MDDIKRIVCMRDYSQEGFERIHAKLDLLHDLASEGRLSEATSMHPWEVIGWLEDIIFTSEETVREIDAHAGSATWADWSIRAKTFWDRFTVSFFKMSVTIRFKVEVATDRVEVKQYSSIPHR